MEWYKTIALFHFFIFSCITAVNAANSIRPINEREHPELTLIDVYGNTLPVDFSGKSMIYSIVPENNGNVEYITFLFLGNKNIKLYSNMDYLLWGYARSIHTITHNLFYFTTRIGDCIPPSFRRQSDLSSEGNQVFIDGQAITLQGLTIDDAARSMTCVKYSSSTKCLGITTHSTRPDEFDKIRLFSSVQGEPINFNTIIIDAEGNTKDVNSASLGNGSHELFFSPTGNYLIGRYFELEYNQKFDFEYYRPKIVMIDVVNRRIVEEADKDVAFTRDGQYFVTERNEVPSLVRSSTLQTVLTYEIDAPMLAAAFSPDDQRLYISDTTNKIYVFESGVDSGCENWEVMK